MSKCIVIGGGLAGLSTAVYLSEKKIPVHVIEASPKLGGRAYSLFNKNFTDVFDNGQHILMGCYHNTLEFLNKIGSSKLLEFQKSLSINFVERGGKLNKLEALENFYPFNFLWGILNYKPLSLKERFKIVDFFLDLACCFEEDLTEKNIDEWLKAKGQSEKSLKAFWEILIVGALNTSPKKASASMFAAVLKRIFFDGSQSASIVIPKVGLSELYIRQSEKFIEMNSGIISTSERVIEVVAHNNRIKKIITDKNVYDDFDYAISTVPPHALDKIIFTCENSGQEKLVVQFKNEINKIQYSSILNVHLWLKENLFDKKFYGLIDSKIHWVFNHGTHISLTTSNADEFNNSNNAEIVEKFCSELEKYFPIFKRNLVVDSKVIKEKRATFIPDTQSNSVRKKVYSPFANLIFAGDWANTGLPSTIESAVCSGKNAAEKIISNINGDTY